MSATTYQESHTWTDDDGYTHMCNRRVWASDDPTLDGMVVYDSLCARCSTERAECGEETR